MKKYYLILLLLLPLFGLTSCAKQKNCDCGLEGVFIYDSNTKLGKLYCNDVLYYVTSGHIPKKIQSTTPIDVNVCIDKTDNLNMLPNAGKIKCIEKSE